MKNVNLLLAKLAFLLIFLSFGLSQFGIAQGVTTGQILGLVTDSKGQALEAATIVATHKPSGTVYGVYSRQDGRYNIPNMRIGGPYEISISYIGFKTKTETISQLGLGQNLRINATLEEDAVALNEVVVSGTKNKLINAELTGASTTIGRESLEGAASLTRNLNDFIRLTPQSRSSSVAATTGPGVSFAGQDSRYNNLTIDGSIYNNNFGLSSSLGGQTNSTPISLDALEEIQINLAPYDVRQAGFTGAGINAVTRSGTNKLEGSVFMNYRNQDFVGKNAGDNKLVISDFDVKQFGIRLSGPIIKDKLFWFANWESERRGDPTTLTAFRDSASRTANTTTVLASDLDEVSKLVKEKWGYETGGYDNYVNNTQSDKGLIKFDYNLCSGHRLSFRYNLLKSKRDVFISNSGTLTSGSNRNSLTALAFKNSNYIINNDVHSFIAELNSIFSSRVSNNFSVGYTANRDYRSSNSAPMPLIDILNGSGASYISLGYEPFTPNNTLNSDISQFQDNLSFYLNNHTLTAGVNYETFSFDNLFTPTYYGQFIFNNLSDFRKAVAGDSVAVRRYALNYSALPNAALPWATTKVVMPGAYLQDEISMLKNKLNVTLGVRVDVPIFKETALKNVPVDTMNFRDENGAVAHYSTDQLPNKQYMFSPRLGFNYDLMGNKKVQLRGGTGVFTGRPPFVWISNVVGNNGVLQGSISQDNTNTRKYIFTNDVTANIPKNATASASYNLALIDKDFKFPQVWRNDLAVDVALPMSFVLTLEGLYSKTLNNIYYINANQEIATGNFSGDDTRPTFPGLGVSGGAKTNASRIYDNISDATVLKNTDKGYSYSLTAKLEKALSNNWSIFAAYNFAEAKDITSAGSIAFNSWRDNKSVNGNNLPDLAFSDFDQRNRVIGGLTYKINYLKNSSTQISLFLQSANQPRGSLFYNGDQNGDNQSGNDLLYVPNKGTDLVFSNLVKKINNKDSIIATAQQQADGFEAYISENPFLNDNRGKVLERNALLLDWLTTVDLAVVQNFGIKFGERTYSLQIRGDIFNFGNLLNNAWGVGDRFATNTPLNATNTKDANGKPIYTFGSISSNNTWTKPLNVVAKRASLEDVWQAQLGVRLTF